ncbi:predicted protein [Streptomyces sp. SPB78]|nr:predicted protein [Streptomyces sp. SPB78]
MRDGGGCGRWEWAERVPPARSGPVHRDLPLDRRAQAGARTNSAPSAPF